MFVNVQSRSTSIFKSTIILAFLVSFGSLVGRGSFTSLGLKLNGGQSQVSLSQFYYFILLLVCFLFGCWFVWNCKFDEKIVVDVQTKTIRETMKTDLSWSGDWQDDRYRKRAIVSILDCWTLSLWRLVISISRFLMTNYYDKDKHLFNNNCQDFDMIYFYNWMKIIVI